MTQERASANYPGEGRTVVRGRRAGPPTPGAIHSQIYPSSCVESCFKSSHVFDIILSRDNSSIRDIY